MKNFLLLLLFSVIATLGAAMVSHAFATPGVQPWHILGGTITQFIGFGGVFHWMGWRWVHK